MSEAVATVDLTDRRQYIGGGDAACIAGHDKYKQPLQLYKEKRGEFGEVDLSDNDSVHFGVMFEDLVANEWAIRNNAKVRRDRIGKVHPDYPWCGGHIDRKVEGRNEGLECKNRSFRVAQHYGEQGSDEVMPSDLVQSMHYMAVTGWERWHVAVYFGGPDFRMYTIERDEAFIAQLLDLEHEFWRSIQDGNAPALDMDHGTTGELLGRLYPGTDGSTIELPQQVLHWKAVADEAAALAKQHQAVADGARLHMKSLMGNAAVGVLPDGSGNGFTRKVVKRKGFTVDATEYVDFRFKKGLAK